MEILIAEDEPISRRLLEFTLRRWGYEVTTAADGSEAWEMLQSPAPPSLVISDWMMPGMDGLELCHRIRSREQPGYTYLIILTARGKKEDVIKGLEAGADDYLVKPFDQEELRCRIKIGERIINLEHRILLLANTDALTGILNRRAFMEKMEIEVERAIRENSPLSLIIADLDHFKQVNDRYGHQVGDLVLQGLRQAVSAQTRPYDFLGRYGGEEFSMGFPGVDDRNRQAHCGTNAPESGSSRDSLTRPLPGHSDNGQLWCSLSPPWLSRNSVFPYHQGGQRSLRGQAGRAKSCVPRRVQRRERD